MFCDTNFQGVSMCDRHTTSSQALKRNAPVREAAVSKSAMDEEYDVIVCGTGLKECILSGLLSTSGKKVLHLDRNGYYGGDTASLNLSTLWEKFRPGEKPPADFGANREWNVDLIPKFIMAAGDLVKILLKTQVSRYLEWKSCEGSYVYLHQEAGWVCKEKRIHKVPATAADGMTSSLMGLLEKPLFINFVQFVVAWDEEKPETMQEFDPRRHTMSQVYEKFGLAEARVCLTSAVFCLLRWVLCCWRDRADCKPRQPSISLGTRWHSSRTTTT